MSVSSKLLQGAVPRSPVKFFTEHIHPSGRPWSFVGHEYLKAILEDDAQHRVIQKAAQVGMSTLSIGTLLHWCLLGHKVGYYLSDREFMTGIVQDRVDPLINDDVLISNSLRKGADNEDLSAAGSARARRKSADNLRIKHIGQGSAWFMGLQKRKDVKSLDLDAYILDEVDEVDQSLAAWLRDRLLHSSFKRIIELSQPSVPDWGINARYEISNQQVYQHKCPRCGTWHVLEEEWPRCLHRRGPHCTVFHPIEDTCAGCAHAAETLEDGPLTEYRMVCVNCFARIRGKGVNTRSEWVARFPGRPIHGYRLSQLYGPHTSAAELATAWQPCDRDGDALENFTISILGLTYAGDKQPLTVEVVNKASGNWGLGLRAYLKTLPEDARPLILGAADIGDRLHAGIGVLWNNVLAIVELAELTDERVGEKVTTAWDKLYRMLSVCDFSVIDGRPDHSQALKLARALSGRLALAYFRGEKFVLTEEDDGVGNMIPVVLQERTTAIDDMAGMVKMGEMMFPNPKLQIMSIFRLQVGKLVKQPNPLTARREYVKGVNNHFGLFATYLEMAHKAAVRLGLAPMADFDPETSTIGGSHAAKEW
jgi:hypothetical protein